jgi:Fe2+ or Zn2+ uptake regulation protein
LTGIATCTACGKIIVFLNDCYADLEVPASINGTLRVIPKRVVLKGLCGDCASEQ